MSQNLKLTPKECLYIDDALSQMCAIATRLTNEKEDVSDSEISEILTSITQVLSDEFENLKQLLKEASA